MQIRLAVPGDESGIATVHVDAWRTTYKGMVSDEFLAALSYERRKELWERNLAQEDNLVFVAVNSDERIVGFASGSSSPKGGSGKYNAELTAIYLLEEIQGTGVGKRLVTELFKAFAGQGHGSVFVWVLEDNKSKHFYEHLGAQKVETAVVRIGDRDLNELGLGWDPEAFHRIAGPVAGSEGFNHA